MEPVTIFSVTLAVLNVLIGTIATGVERVDQFWTFPDTILQHYYALCACKLKLELWTLRWKSSDVVERRNQELFGDETWREIMNWHQRVQQSVARLEDWIRLKEKEPKPEPKKLKKPRRIFGRSSSATSVASETAPEGLAATDEERWNAIIADIESPRNASPTIESARGQPKLKDDFVRRILSMLGRHKVLEERVKSATSNVDRLDEYTRLKYEGLGYNQDGAISSESLASDHDKFAFVSLAQQLYYCHILKECNIDEHGRWFLQLRLPDESQDCEEFWRQKRLRRDLHFTTSKRSVGARLISHEVSTSKSRPSTNGQTVNNQAVAAKFSELRLDELHSTVGCQLRVSESVYTLRSYPGPRMISKPWNMLLDLCERSQHERSVLQLQRARLAYSLTIWMVLLWGTPFMSTICCCSLRCVEFGHEVRSGVFRSEYQAICAPCELPACHALQHVVLGDLQLRKLPALGKVLAELMLGKNLSKDFDVDPVMKEVDKAVMCAPSSFAVWWCLNMEFEVLDSLPRPQQIRALVTNVVKPLKAYLDTTMAEVKRSSRFEKYGTELGYKNQYRDELYCSLVPRRARALVMTQEVAMQRWKIR